MAAAETTAAPGVTVERLPAADVPPALEERLMELTLPTGDMAKVYRACARGDRRWQGQVIVARADGVVAGWALRWKLDHHWHKWCLHLFVHPDHRRCGVATLLVDAARYRLRRDTRLRGFVWDDTSAAFWATVDLPTVDAPDLRN